MTKKFRFSFYNNEEKTMEISKEFLLEEASNIGISKDKAEALWNSLERKKQSTSSFSKLLFYFGALIIISAMTWFMGLSWQIFGGGGIFLIASAYALLFTFLGMKLWPKEELRIPAGLFITIAVCMVPLAIYGLEALFNIWPDESPESYKDFYTQIKGSWILMEIGTILAGLLALKYFPFPFITAPIFFAAWFLAMDIAALGNADNIENRYWITLIFGLALLAISYFIDRKKLKEDYAFWGYLFGGLAFWGALGCLMWDKSEAVLFLYFLINLAFMALSILLKRKVLMVYGALGTFGYLSHLAYEIFKDSLLFPFVLSGVGLAIIYLGVLYQRNAEKIEAALRKFLPDSIREHLP